MNGREKEKLAVETLEEAEVESEQRMDQVKRHLEFEELLYEEKVHGLD